MSDSSLRPVTGSPAVDEKAAWIARVLGVSTTGQAPSGTPPPARVSLVRLGRARIEWRDTLAGSRADMAALKQSLDTLFEGADDPQGLVPAALTTLDTAMAELDDSLSAQLDAVLNAGEQDRPALIARAQATMQAFRSHVESDPVMAALDANEVRPQTAITGPLKQKLAEIDAAFT